MKKLKIEHPSYKAILIDFQQWLDILGYAPTSVYSIPILLQEFFYYLEQNQVLKVENINAQKIKDYYQLLKERANQRQDGALSKSYLNKHQQALKKFNEYLKQHHHKGISIHLKSEKKPNEERLNILTQEEVLQLFEATQNSHKLQRIRIRDKAILVLLYSCGLRRNEVVNLEIKDIYFEKERIHVRKGKNYKERFVPINLKNARILEDYLYEARNEFHQSYLSESFLLGSKGTPLGGMSLANRLKAIVEATQNKDLQEKQITPHTLRHSIATHLLQKEVPIENIKTFLGHTSLETTQIYTHLISES